jgi:iturin family lipopeptide synthetase A
MDVAIVGMSARFPAAPSFKSFWRNIVRGVESISSFSRDALREAGVDPMVLESRDYVAAGGTLDEIESFDASFFGYTPREAALIDPQQRVFLECSWGALEDAGYTPARGDLRTGVFAGVGINTYLLSNVLPSLDSGDEFLAFICNDKDFIATRTSYKLGLRGPSIGVQTACSSSLVAVHLACRSLLLGECDLALAGGSSIRVPQQRGYQYRRDGIESPDGHCRAFDEDAAGTVFGNGVGVVVLRRLEDAVAGRDNIYAVIKGSSVNNDGSGKVGFTAPSFEGQAEVIAEALAVAECDPETLSFIEAHGTGTALGDAIEVQALKHVFAEVAGPAPSCALSSVKANVGHLDTAAGVAGLIKAALALRYRLLPPTAHFRRAHPRLGLEGSPFFVNDRLLPLERGATPLRCGVSSFGIGGSNAHVVLEEAPATMGAPARGFELLTVSARTPVAQARALEQISAALAESHDLNLSDVAYTLQVGREAFPFRAMVVCDRTDLASARMADPASIETGEASEGRRLCWLFPGQGSHYVSMGKGLFGAEPEFTAQMTRCARILRPLLGFDLLELLFARPMEAARQQLAQTCVTQPALFAIEYALGCQLRSWGIRPDVLLGHSLGEYVAACLAGVFGLEAGLALVALRARLMQEQAPGAMVAVRCSREDVEPFLAPAVSLAAVNGPQDCVLSGPAEAVQWCLDRLTAAEILHRSLEVSHAFHSGMMEPVLGRLEAELRRIDLRPPQIPIVSNLTGDVLSAEDATNPEYWCRHLRNTVEFSHCLGRVFTDATTVGLEVGPAHILTDLARRHPGEDAGRRLVTPTMRHPADTSDDREVLLQAVGRLWMAGIAIDWDALHAGRRPRRVSLPTYPFARERHWIERPSRRPDQGPPVRGNGDGPPAAVGVEPELTIPAWTQWDGRWGPAGPSANGRWLVFVEDPEEGQTIARAIAGRGGIPLVVLPGAGYSRCGDGAVSLNPSDPEGFRALVAAELGDVRQPCGIIYSWRSLGGQVAGGGSGSPKYPAFDALVSLIRALDGARRCQDVRLAVVARAQFDVTGGERLYPEDALLLGVMRAVVREQPGLSCLFADVDGPCRGGSERAGRLVADLLAPNGPRVLAYRGDRAWDPRQVPVIAAAPEPRRPGTVFVITGGVGNIGLEVAEALVELGDGEPVSLYLTGRSRFPSNEEWPRLLRRDGTSASLRLRIERLTRLQEAGAAVRIRPVDAADLGAMRGLVDEIAGRHGAIDGVLHAAGTVGRRGFAPVAELSPEIVAAHFEAKVQGVNVLASALHGRDVGFCFLFSSLATHLGGIGYAAYAAANAYMDAFARSQARNGTTRWLSIAWDAWDFAEGTRDAGPIPDVSGMSPGQGRKVLHELLRNHWALPGGEIAVSNGAIAPRCEEWQRAARTISPPAPIAPPPAGSGNIRGMTPLGELWSRTLGVNEARPGDNFFALGGSSLLAIQLLAAIRATRNVDISLQQFLDGPTFGELSATAARSQSASPPPGVIPRAPRDRPLPLSYAQQQLWVAESSQDASGLFHITGALHLTGRLDVGALARSFQAMVARHEILRTRFAAVDGQPFQEVVPVPDDLVRVTALERPSRTSLEDAVRPIADAEFTASFNLETGRLVRVRILAASDVEHVVLITIHHLIADDWSVGVLLEELGRYYAHFSNGALLELPELPIQYGDYAVWQRTAIDEESIRLHLAYWKERLDGAPHLLALPADHPAPAARSARGGCKRFELPADRMAMVRRLGQQESVSPFMVLLAAFKCLLRILCRTDDIVVGTPAAGRDHPQLSNLVGYFVNPVVLRTDLSGTTSFSDVLRRVRETTLEAHAHATLPFDRLVAETRREEGPSSRLLFNVLFTVLTHSARGRLHADVGMDPLRIEIRPARFDLALLLEPRDEAFSGSLEYSLDLFEPTTADRIVQGYLFLLDRVLEDPGSAPSDLAEEFEEYERRIRAERASELQNRRRNTLVEVRRRVCT